jgi:hypothetical protein
MWIPKWQRDRQRGVGSPVPTQVVSNGEFHFLREGPASSRRSPRIPGRLGCRPSPADLKGGSNPEVR